LSYVDRLLQRQSDLVELVKCPSVDPVRLDNVSDEILDALFAKLDSYVKLLVSMKCVESSVLGFGDLSPRRIYNADEVQLNTLKRDREFCILEKAEGRKKMKQSKSRQKPTRPKGQNFRRTKEGDKKMKRHVTIMVTSRADGKLLL